MSDGLWDPKWYGLLVEKVHSFYQLDKLVFVFIIIMIWSVKTNYIEVTVTFQSMDLWWLKL